MSCQFPTLSFQHLICLKSNQNSKLQDNHTVQLFYFISIGQEVTFPSKPMQLFQMKFKFEFKMYIYCTYMYMYIWMYMYICIYTYMHIHTHMYIYTHIHAYAYICTYMCVYVYVCLFFWQFLAHQNCRIRHLIIHQVFKESIDCVEFSETRIANVIQMVF